MNPLDLLDGLVPAKYRKTVHLLLLLAAALFSIWMAADGDWRKFAVGLAGAIYTASNAANTSGD